MISSEVQRTLVKSPPELWAELSDPAALARHLGELGVIRITRIEPERTVEWEAENASGTVQIKASGWGTRVTLSATRETATPEPPAESLAPPEGEHTETDPPEPAGPSPWDAEPGASGPTEGEPAWPADATALDPEGEPGPDPEPPLQAAQPDTETDPEPAAELIDPEPAAELIDPEPDAELGLDREGELIDPEPDDEMWLTEAEEPEGRRGFFARLFGRRRRARALEAEPPDELSPLEEPIDVSDEDFVAEADAGPELLEPPAPMPAPETEAGARRADARAETVLEAWQAVYEPVPQAPGAADDGGTAAVMEQPAHEADAPEQAAADTPTEAAADAPDEAPADAPGPVAGISAELKTAEEAATAEVTALLTSVLDRLGAAHHRPFSRG